MPDGMAYVVYKNVGTVDYSKGLVTLGSKFYPEISEGIVYGITITAIPEKMDLFVKENRVIRINRGYSDSVSISLITQLEAQQTAN